MASLGIDRAPLTIGIVGAGISGLSSAIACALAGHHVTIFEGAKELAEVSRSNSISNTEVNGHN
jgi:salicylate hydroxylase